MGSLTAHIAASILLCTLGIRYLVCSFSSYVKSPRQYIAKPWYDLADKWKNLDLLILIISLPIAAIAEVIWSLTSNGNNSNNPTYPISYMDEAVMLMGFWVFVVAVYFDRKTEIVVLGSEILFMVAGIAFVVEWMVAREGRIGLETKCYDLLGGVSVICGVCCVVLAWQPGVLLAEVSLAGGMVLQGTWTLHIGLTLMTSSFMPKGCHLSGGVAQCELEEATRRAITLLQLGFICNILIILVLGILLFWIIAHKHGFTRDGDYTPVSADVEPEHIQMHPLPKFEIESE